MVIKNKRCTYFNVQIQEKNKIYLDYLTVVLNYNIEGFY